MTEQQHRQVVEVLTQKIRANNGSMMLNQVSPTLGAAGIDVYKRQGPWWTCAMAGSGGRRGSTGPAF